MPEKYLRLRDEFIRQGKPAAKAKTSAAKIFNAQRKPGTAPVVPGAYERSLGDTVTRKRY
jgi:hypothetical protein